MRSLLDRLLARDSKTGERELDISLNDFRDLLQEYFTKQSLKKKIKLITALKIEEPIDYAKEKVLLDISNWGELTRLRSAKKEPLTILWLEKAIQKGDVLYDIGANVGAYSLIAAAITKGQCKVHAFEPVPANYEKLCRNIFLNGFENIITPYPLALGPATEATEMMLTGLAPGRGTHAVEPEQYEREEQKLYDQRGENEKPRNFPILAFTLDELRERFALPCPNHIKIDVEGYELPVFRGAAKTLADPALRSVILEVREEASMQESERQLTDLLERGGLKRICYSPKFNKKGERDSFAYAVYGREPIAGLPSEFQAP